GNTVQAVVVPSFSVPPVAGVVVSSVAALSGAVVAPDSRGTFTVAYQAGRRASQAIRVTPFSVSGGRIAPGDSAAISAVGDANVDPAALVNAGSSLLATWTHVAPGNESVMASTFTDPAPPRRVRASSRKPGQITVSWRAPLGGASGYVVQVRRGAGAWSTKATPGPDATSWRWTRARSGSDYEVRMASTRGSVVGDWSPIARVTAR
ncbi:MAG: fibronectin type III domain-containing protein, partial [Candidatus Nanopelagicales bacterium]